ncbi:flagellin [Aciditerrimonas ferrireducens]|jgi:flagellin|uniref:Flagellin n=1 Tax=Aciditerrimonas ferrireducens TaxID=667306 RepID=A0ABV6C0R3_9ACTN
MSSLVINTNLSAINAYNNLNATDNQLNNVISELSSGLQIQTAADNPAGYVISQGLEAQSNGYQQAIANAQNGVSLIQTASGALNQIESILQTMNQLATASANGATNDSNSLNANEQEFAALQNQIDQIASTTSFGTTNLLDGSFSNEVLQVGAFDYQSQQVTFSIQAVTTTALGVASTNVSINSVASAQAAMSAVQAAIATVASVEASVGAIQNQLEAVVANLTVGQQNLQAAYSQLVDVNFAEATTQFTTDQILEQSGVAMLSQAQQAPALALKLLP